MTKMVPEGTRRELAKNLAKFLLEGGNIYLYVCIYSPSALPKLWSPLLLPREGEEDPQHTWQVT